MKFHRYETTPHKYTDEELKDIYLNGGRKVIIDERNSQPERSKREDFCLTKLADRYIDEWNTRPCDFATMDEAYIKGVYDFSDWLKQEMRCSEHDSNAVRDK